VWAMRCGTCGMNSTLQKNSQTLSGEGVRFTAQTIFSGTSSHIRTIVLRIADRPVGGEDRGTVHGRSGNREDVKDRQNSSLRQIADLL
jgi:hypothetical protein